VLKEDGWDVPSYGDSLSMIEEGGGGMTEGHMGTVRLPVTVRKKVGIYIILDRCGCFRCVVSGGTRRRGRPIQWWEL